VGRHQLPEFTSPQFQDFKDSTATIDKLNAFVKYGAPRKKDF